MRISENHMAAFRAALEASFAERLFDHACSTYSKPTRLFGPACMRELVQLTIQKCAGYALVSDKAHRLLFRLVLECGTAFDSDPLIGFASPILNASAGERDRIAQLASAADHYSAKVAPAMRSAALSFRHFRMDWNGGRTQEHYLRDVRQCCSTLFPEKASLVCEGAWAGVLQQTTAVAAEREWRTMTAHAVLFALFFLAGAGFLHDPRFAFVSEAMSTPTNDTGRVLHQVTVSRFEQWFTDVE